MAGLPSGRAEGVAPNKALQRAIVSKRLYFKETLRPKPGLFCPNPHVELSVHRIEDLGEREAKDLADRVAQLRGKDSSLGDSQIRARFVCQEGLGAQPDEPPLHHANIVGWPDDSDPDERKRLQLQIAKRLVESAGLVRIWGIQS